MCVPPIISVQNWHWLQWDFSAKTKKVFYFLTKVLCSCHLYVLVVWRVFVFFPFQKILPFDMTLSLPLNNNMSHTEGILLFCGHHVKERISSNKKYIHFYDMKKRLIVYIYSILIKKWNLRILQNRNIQTQWWIHYKSS